MSNEEEKIKKLKEIDEKYKKIKPYERMAFDHGNEIKEIMGNEMKEVNKLYGKIPVHIQ